jgi:hypothetical protein
MAIRLLIAVTLVVTVGLLLGIAVVHAYAA